MVKSATITLFACAASAFIAGGCKNKEPETGNQSLQEMARPAPDPASEVQKKRDLVLEEFNTRLKSLDGKILAANTRISKMGKKKNWSWRNKVEVVEARKKKVVEESIEIGKKPVGRQASGLSKLIASLEPLARDMDQLLKKME